jgi:hypothetical protein
MLGSGKVDQGRGGKDRKEERNSRRRTMKGHSEIL